MCLLRSLRTLKSILQFAKVPLVRAAEMGGNLRKLREMISVCKLWELISGMHKTFIFSQAYLHKL